MAGGGGLRDLPVTAANPLRVWVTRSIRRLVAGAVAGLLVAVPAWGQGGSGAGGCGDELLEKAVASGSVDEFIAVLDQRVSYRRKQLEEALTNRIFGMTVSSPKAAQLPTREELAKFYVNRRGCYGVLLDHAVAAGNIPVINALLAAGADVNGRPDGGSEFFVQDGAVQRRRPNADEETLLMRCWRVAGQRNEITSSYFPLANDDHRARTRRGFDHILSRGADVTLLNRQGNSAIEVCSNPDALALFARRVDPNRPLGKQSHLNFWINKLFQATLRGEADMAAAMSALDETLPALRSKMLDPQEELDLCAICGSRSYAAACAALKERIQVTDERMFQTDASLGVAATARHRVERCVEYQQEDRSRPRPWDVGAYPSTCSFATRYLPNEVVAVAAGGRGGRPLDFQIDESGDVATQFDVKVHADQPVTLLLVAHEPTVWAVSWTPGTRIAAVYATGYSRQLVTGLPPGTPLIVSSESSREGCGNSFKAERQLQWDASDAARAREILGQDVARVVRSEGRDGVLDIKLSARPVGTYESSPGLAPESYRDARMPFAGVAGLQWAVDQGLLRLATDAERELGKGRTGWMPKGGHTYVVLKPMTLPAGLYGNAFAAPAGVVASTTKVFIVPQGVPVPRGSAAGSAVVDLNRDGARP